MLSPVRPSSVCMSVCHSVCPSVTRVDQSKTIEVRIMQLSPQSSPNPLVFVVLIQKFQRVPPEQGRSDGGRGYIGIYTPPNQSTFIFYVVVLSP